ncbi:hypothetical protein BGV71_08140 [Burkholderia ubonensis]|uniref:hypothetical protein n=1 Tax=Burkholderia ubonensis TaxID=101571 RepID=UPI0008FDF237|nr:hypothetical protein [Burkholderia ubonensis]OJA89694.1 hypothetical protein BGV71_08140 [Burkholderia ubonensis]
MRHIEHNEGTSKVIQYTGPHVLAELIKEANTAYYENPRRIKALRVVCEASETAMVANDYALFDSRACVMTPDFQDWSFEMMGHRKLLNPAYRRRLCVIELPQYFMNLSGFLRARGELVVLVCQPDRSDTHPEMDLSPIMRRDLRPLIPPMPRIKLI